MWTIIPRSSTSIHNPDGPNTRCPRSQVPKTLTGTALETSIGYLDPVDLMLLASQLAPPQGSQDLKDFSIADRSQKALIWIPDREAPNHTLVLAQRVQVPTYGGTRSQTLYLPYLSGTWTPLTGYFGATRSLNSKGLKRQHKHKDLTFWFQGPI